MIEPVGQDGHAGGAAAPVPSAPHVVQIPADRSVTGREETVWLHPEVTLPLGIAAMTAFRQAMGQGLPVAEGLLAEVYLRLGIERWTFRDARGDPEEVDSESVARLLPFSHGGLEVAEAADALYGRAVTDPLARRLSARSPTGPTPATTPPTPLHGRSRRTPSGRSSRSATAGRPSGGPGR